MNTRSSYFFTEDFINQVSYLNKKEYELSRRQSHSGGHLPCPPKHTRRHHRSLPQNYSSKQLEKYRKLYFNSIKGEQPDDRKTTPVSKAQAVSSKSLTETTQHSPSRNKLIESRKTRSLDSPGSTIFLVKHAELEFNGVTQAKETVCPFESGLEFPKDTFKSHEIKRYLQQRYVRRAGIFYENPKEIKEMLKGSRNTFGFFK